MQEEQLPWVKGTTVIARLFVHAPDSVASFFDRAAAAGVRGTRCNAAGAAAGGAPPQPPPDATPGSALLLDFLATTADSFDAVAQPADRKLVAMAFAAALTAPTPGILSLFEVLLAHVTSVYLTLEESAAENGGDDPCDHEAYGVLLGAGADGGGIDDVAVAMSDDAEGARLDTFSRSPGYNRLVCSGLCPCL
jgi:hypothetical protein